MANTSYLRYVVEPWIRGQLETRWGKPFSSQVLELRPAGTHEFDAVAEDRSVVVSIKTSSGLTSGGNIPSGKINTCLAELYYLTLVDAPVRTLLLTNAEFRDILVSRLHGALAPGITIELLALPEEMQREVDSVILAASKEMSLTTADQAAVVEEQIDPVVSAEIEER